MTTTPRSVLPWRQPYVRGALLWATGLATCSTLYVVWLSIFEPNWRRAGAMAYAFFFATYLSSYSVGAISACALWSHPHEGMRRVCGLLTLGVVGAVAYTHWNSARIDESAISVGWYMSGTLVALAVLAATLEWLRRRFVKPAA